MIKTIVILLFTTVVSAQVTLIPDTSFEQALLDQNIDTDGVLNGQVSTANVESLSELNVSFYNIEDLTGIEDFVALEILNAQYNMISNVDITTLENLRILNFDENGFDSLDVSQNVNLEELYIGNPEEDASPFNSYTTLDLSNNPNLRVLSCFFNINLTDLDISNNPLLEELILPFCGLNSLDVSNNINLMRLDLGFLYLPDPETLSNDLINLDVSNNVNLENLSIGSTTLRSVNAKNGIENEMVVNAEMAQQLECIQVDDESAAIAGTGEYANWIVEDDVTYTESDCVLSLDNFTRRLPIVLYPNPTDDVVNITFKALRNLKVLLIDSFGNFIKEVNNTSSFSVDDLSSGAYFIVIYDENRFIGTKKFVVL